jgi:hypothetical protein
MKTMSTSCLFQMQVSTWRLCCLIDNVCPYAPQPDQRYCARFRVSLAQNTHLELHSVIQAARCPTPEPSSFIASLQATPPRAPPRPPPPTMCTKDAPLRNDVPVHDFPIRAPVAYTRGAGRTRYPLISGRVSIISIAIYASRSCA